jgi:hypothetical protein
MVRQDFVQGCSMSLNKTISELMTFLGDGTARPRGQLRGFLNEKLADFAKHWYTRGVKRGHRKSYKEFKATGAVPARLPYKGTRKLFGDKERQLRFTSKIKTTS